jgi:Fe2+ or Zn2+ uptake regulation protein
VAIGRNHRIRDALEAAAEALTPRAFSVRELHESARAAEPRLSLATAYRTVDRWRSEGMCEDAGARGGEAVVVMCGRAGHHHHVVCTGCGAESVLDRCPMDDLRAAAARAGFELAEDALGAVPGRCQECRTAQSPP